MVASMTLEERVGQLFFVHCPAENAEELIIRYHVGGLLLFARDFENKTPAQVQSALQSYQDSAGIPLLIGVDEEGGAVTRVSRFPQFRASPFPSPRALYRDGGLTRIESDTIEKARLLKFLGINLNLSPVCDMTEDASAYIYPRTIGGDPALASDYVRTVVSTMKREGIGCTLKHFPGYGGSADTHAGPAYDGRSLEDFINRDFLPFIAGIDAGAGAVMMGHTVAAGIDGTAPASLSPAVHRILRDRLGFDGVIMTDDLNMAAVRDYAKKDSAAVLAILAGNDMVCCPDYETQIPAVIAAVRDGTIPETTLDAAVRRVLTWKLELGILH
jgi:beta-N-acetylhexosaminidase